MPGQNEQFNKITSAELRRLATEDSHEPVTVLIQPNLPQRQIEARAINRGGITISVPTRVVEEVPEDLELVERRVAETGAFLEELGTSPRWLRSARTFVARVTPAQLRVIANSPQIKAIWPNRTLGSTTGNRGRGGKTLVECSDTALTGLV